VKIENVREVKARLSRLISDLPKTGSVVITKNGKPCAALMPVGEDTDLEVLALSQNKRFWRMFDAARARAEKEGWVDLDDIDPPRVVTGSRSRSGPRRNSRSRGTQTA